jgi:hypothetical protein
MSEPEPTPEDLAAKLRDARIKLASITETGELASEQTRALDDELTTMATDMLAFVESLPADAPMPDALADMAQSIDGMVANRRPLVAQGGQTLATLLARLDDPHAPADELPGQYEHMAVLLDGQSATVRATAAIARLRNAMHARGWL